MAAEKAEQSRAAAGEPSSVHLSDDLIKRPVVLLLDDRQNFLGMVVER